MVDKPDERDEAEMTEKNRESAKAAATPATAEERARASRRALELQRAKSAEIVKKHLQTSAEFARMGVPVREDTERTTAEKKQPVKVEKENKLPGKTEEEKKRPEKTEEEKKQPEKAEEEKKKPTENQPEPTIEPPSTIKDEPEHSWEYFAEYTDSPKPAKKEAMRPHEVAKDVQKTPTGQETTNKTGSPKTRDKDTEQKAQSRAVEKSSVDIKPIETTHQSKLTDTAEKEAKPISQAPQAKSDTALPKEKKYEQNTQFKLLDIPEIDAKVAENKPQAKPADSSKAVKSAIAEKLPLTSADTVDTKSRLTAQKVSPNPTETAIKASKRADKQENTAQNIASVKPRRSQVSTSDKASPARPTQQKVPQMSSRPTSTGKKEIYRSPNRIREAAEPAVPTTTTKPIQADSQIVPAQQQLAVTKSQPRQDRKVRILPIVLICVGVVVVALLILLTLWIRGNTEEPAQNQMQLVDTGLNDPLISLYSIPTDGEVKSTAEVVDIVDPSVVSLAIYTEEEIEPIGYGSGVIASSDGYIVTCAHVIDGASSIHVEQATGEGYTAAVIGRDSQTDLALLKIEAQNLTPATFADPGNLRRGQEVMTLGNAAGVLPGTPAKGILSGIDRSFALPLEGGLEVEIPLLQTDAAINPGCSGGALANMYGQVIGIIVSKIQMNDIDNIGFAISSDIVQAAVESMRAYGDISPTPELGIVALPLNETNTSGTGLPGEGLYIAEIAAGSDLEAKGVSVGDVLLEAGGATLHTLADLREALRGLVAGEKVELLVYFAQTGSSTPVTVTLHTPSPASAAAPDSSSVAQSQPDSTAVPDQPADDTANLDDPAADDSV